MNPINDSPKNYINIPNISVEVYDSVPSTNTMLKERGKIDAPHGLVIAAREQTAGRGRMGRSFYSPSDTGIYFSVLLRPSLSVQDCQLITTAAAVACARVLEKFAQAPAKIKWVNDIYIHDKKVCGILTETCLKPNGTLDFAVLGIGINITAPRGGFPSDLIYKAGGVLKTSEEDLRWQIMGEILNEFFPLYHKLTEKVFFHEYRSRSLLDGHQIEVIKQDLILPATALYIDEELRLAVQYENGIVEHLYTGDVSIKKL